MELKEYLKIIKRGISLVLSLTLLVGLAALIFTASQETLYETSLSLSISRADTQETLDYKYDQYYAIQASELFANTVEQWLKSPEVATKIYQKAEVELPVKSLRKLTKKFRANKMASQYVEVGFKAKSKDEAKRISSATLAVLQDKAALLSQVDRTALFSIIGAEPVIVEDKPDIGLNTFLGLVTGLFLGIGLAFLKEYFRA